MKARPPTGRVTRGKPPAVMLRQQGQGTKDVHRAGRVRTAAVRAASRVAMVRVRKGSVNTASRVLHANRVRPTINRVTGSRKATPSRAATRNRAQATPTCVPALASPVQARGRAPAMAHVPATAPVPVRHAAVRLRRGAQAASRKRGEVIRLPPSTPSTKRTRTARTPHSNCTRHSPMPVMARVASWKSGSWPVASA